eukprot:2797105-Heterocapsa_arctica.AAC.1
MKGGKGIKGAASEGLATLISTDRHIRKISPAVQGPHWTEGRWQHTGIEAGGTTIHIFNVY